MKKIILLIMAVSISSQLFGGSIWAKRTENKKSLYADDTARQVGDILTIVIAEEHKTDNKVSRDLSSKTSRSTTFNGELGIKTPNSNLLPRMPGFTMSAESDRDLSGASDYKDERTIEDRITVIVEDILENGNLVIIGKRQRDIAGDTQIIQVSGIVRPSDILFDNTISSNQVANFHIITINEGVSENYNKPGWLGRVFDFIWPF